MAFSTGDRLVGMKIEHTMLCMLYFQLDAPHELFSLVTGLEVKDGSEADIVTQIRRYQKNQAVRKGLSAEVVQVEGLEAEAEDNFDYCWDQSLDLKITEDTYIPGH